MRQFIFVISLLAAGMASADPVADWQAARDQPVPAADLPRDAFTWVARPVVVFADSDRDPRFVQQMEALSARPEDLAERDVVIITDTDPAAGSAWREALRPRGFMVVLIAKDGVIAARRPAPQTLREVIRHIDKMPLRQQEARDRRGGR